MENFDDLFNNFFGMNPKNELDRINKEIKKEDKKTKDLEEKISDLKNFMKILKDSDGDVDFSQFGDPIKVQYFEKDGGYHQVSTYNAFGGDIVRTIISSEPFPEENKIEVKTLEQKLEEAIEAEDYELAAELRDMLSKNSD